MTGYEASNVDSLAGERRLIDFVYHATLGLRVIQKKKKKKQEDSRAGAQHQRRQKQYA